MSGVALAVGGGMMAVGMYGQYQSSRNNRRAADAAGAAAQMELEEAKQVRSNIYRYGTRAKDEQNYLARATPQELRAIEEQFGAAMRQLENDEKLLSAVDPALMEASQQALKLLRGEDAASVAPLKRQREEQRQALINSLREQYGGSAESSSLGIKALRQFDNETSQLLQGAQRGTMGALLGVAGGARPNMSNNVSAIGASLGSMGNIQQRRLGASQVGWGQLMSNYSGTSNAVVSSAGAPMTSQVLSNQANAQMWGNIGNQFSNLGGMAMGAGMTGYMGGSTNQMIGGGMGNMGGGGGGGYGLGNYGQGPAGNFWGL